MTQQELTAVLVELAQVKARLSKVYTWLEQNEDSPLVRSALMTGVFGAMNSLNQSEMLIASYSTIALYGTQKEN